MHPEEIDNSDMRMLLAPSYDAKSHRCWRQALISYFPQHDWTSITLPPHHFTWRIRAQCPVMGF